ncbi:LptE family protein [Albibacterium bauzanense]|uniref:Lipopolysaccharide assembly protein n=1 Tax=Albibacterium bauzanense TaxID=653929 RepID=A0A4R1LV91_9SPHI|nr:LptE family protein [Albibacterium bauzanense]TCK82772.1 lipopolysaccharide assembly protein [Albibacterium bauzanense]
MLLAIKNKLSYALLLFAAIGFNLSCGIYSFTGASIPPTMKTVSVDFFENNAPLVVSYLSTDFTEALKERIRNQSSLSMVRTDADASFSGRITGYTINPTAVQGNDRAGLNRLSITVSVKYTNSVNPTYNFDESFTRFKDFSTNAGPIQSQEQQLIKEINTMLTEDIFNRAFANW